VIAAITICRVFSNAFGQMRCSFQNAGPPDRRGGPAGDAIPLHRRRDRRQVPIRGAGTPGLGQTPREANPATQLLTCHGPARAFAKAGFVRDTFRATVVAQVAWTKPRRSRLAVGTAPLWKKTSLSTDIMTNRFSLQRRHQV